MTKTIYVDFDALPEGRGKNGCHLYTKEQDAIILKYFPTRRRRDFTELFSKRFFPVASSSLARRYKELKQA